MASMKATAEMTKAQEIEVLEAIAKAQAPGSYMGQFFTPELVEWMKGQIEADFGCDLMHDVHYWETVAQEVGTREFELRRKFEAAEVDHAERVMGLEDQLINAQHEAEALRAELAAEREARRLNGELIAQLVATCESNARMIEAARNLANDSWWGAEAIRPEELRDVLSRKY